MELTYSYTTALSEVSSMFLLKSRGNESAVITKGNQLQVPHAGNGYAHFYELEPGFAVLFVDYTFSEASKIIRNPKKSSEYYGLHINLTTTPVIANKQSGREVDIGTDWSNAILFSSSSKGIEKIIPAGTRFIEVTVIMDYFWFKKNYRDAHVPEAMKQLWELKENMPLQLTLDLTLPILSIVEDMMAISLPDYLKNTYYSGEAKKLLALFLSELTIKPARRRKEILNLAEVEEIMRLKEELERNVLKPLPQMQWFCDKLQIGRSKFNTLFRHIYGKTFTEIVLEIKMQHAAQLLIKNIHCSDVATMLGYKNASNFARIFKEYFKTTPKLYQLAEQHKGKVKK